jgi:transposase
MPRKYVKIDVYGKEILELKREGKTNREIAQKLGADRKCIRNWVFRFNRQQRKLAAGIKLHPKGRPRKDAQPRDIVAEQAYEINRLKMENELLRDFMRSMERK